MRVVHLKFFYCLLMQDCIVLVQPIDTREVVHVQEVHARPQQTIDRIVVAQDRLLLFVPFRLCRGQTDVVYPVLSTLQPHHFDVLVAQLVG